MTGPAPGRRRLFLPVLVGAFILISVAEVWLLTAVGARIGVLPTLAILIGEALLGAWLLRREGSKAWQALVEAYSTGRLPSGQLADAALVLVGGMMLILPGFFTDIIGLACLLPWTRPLSRRALGLLIARHTTTIGWLDAGGQGSPYDAGTVIKGETVESPASPPSDPTIIRGELDD